LLQDYAALTPEQQAAFRAALAKFVDDLRAARGFRPGLRVKGVKGAPGVFEMTWAPNGRATFSYGASIRDDEPHIVWRRVGTHDVIG
jgi:hypothetical protein